jgi:hypothetical protein
MMNKKQNLYTQFFAKNKMVESTDHETGISDRSMRAKIVMKVRVLLLKLKCVNSTMSGGRSFCASFMIPLTTLCIVMFAERQFQILLAKPNLLPKRKPEALKSLYRSPGYKKNQLVLCKNSYVKTMSCSDSHLGITINIKNTKFVKDLPMIDA